MEIHLFDIHVEQRNLKGRLNGEWQMEEQR
jgi:hypothetical protein